MGVGLDGAGTDPEGVGDLGLAEVGPVAQDEHFALPQFVQGRQQLDAPRSGKHPVIGTGCRRELAGVGGLGPHLPVSDDSVALCAAAPLMTLRRRYVVAPAECSRSPQRRWSPIRASWTMSSARDWSPSKSVARRTIGAHATAYSRSIAWSTLWSLTVTILMQ